VQGLGPEHRNSVRRLPRYVQTLTFGLVSWRIAAMAAVSGHLDTASGIPRGTPSSLPARSSVGSHLGSATDQAEAPSRRQIVILSPNWPIVGPLARRDRGPARADRALAHRRSRPFKDVEPKSACRIRLIGTASGEFEDDPTGILTADISPPTEVIRDKRALPMGSSVFR
jgi:hypothetical protein